MKMVVGSPHHKWGTANKSVSPGLRGDFPVLVVEGDADRAELLVKSLASCYLKIRFTVATDWLEAAFYISRTRPRILIMNLSPHPTEGFESLAFIKMVAARPEYQSIVMVVCSELGFAEFEIQGGVPANTVFFEHPLNFDRLKGFIEAHAQL